MTIGHVFGTAGGAFVSRLLGAAEHEPVKADEIRHLVGLLGADATSTSATTAYGPRARPARR